MDSQGREGECMIASGEEIDVEDGSEQRRLFQ